MVRAMSMPEFEVEDGGMGWKIKKETKEVDEAWRKRYLNSAPGSLPLNALFYVVEERKARKEGADSKQ